jgi:hypothetical protein
MLAGGAMELVVAPEWLLPAMVPSSVAGSPVESSGRSVVIEVLVLLRKHAARRPRAEVLEMKDSAFEDLDRAVFVDQAGVVRGRAGWRCLDTEERSTSWPHGGSVVSKQEWSSGGFRRRDVLCVEDEAGVQEDLFVISYVSWAFLYETWSI